MTRLYRLLIAGCWGSGLLLVLLAVLVRLVPAVAQALTVSARGLLILAGTLFLAVLATVEMEKPA